jgi:hypothetical protein
MFTAGIRERNNLLQRALSLNSTQSDNFMISVLAFITPLLACRTEVLAAYCAVFPAVAVESGCIEYAANIDPLPSRGYAYADG